MCGQREKRTALSGICLLRSITAMSPFIKAMLSALCDILESCTDGGKITHASITAMGFFKKRGYRVLKEQKVQRSGIYLTNYVMEK